MKGRNNAVSIRNFTKPAALLQTSRSYSTGTYPQPRYSSLKSHTLFRKPIWILYPFTSNSELSNKYVKN